MDKRWLNVVFYIIGSISTAHALAEVDAIKPWTKTFTTFGTAMFAIGRWDRVLPLLTRKPPP